MLNVMLKDGQGIINIQGSATEILADITILLRSVWEELNKKDEDLAKVFEMFCNDFISSGAIFEKEDDDFEKAVKEKVKQREDKKEDLKELIKELKELLK